MKADQVIIALRAGAFLQLTHTETGRLFQLRDEWCLPISIDEDVATAVIEDPEVMRHADTLFDDVMPQTYSIERVGETLTEIFEEQIASPAPDQFFDGRALLYRGDCLEVLRELEESSIDSCVCDPPYHLTSVVKRFGSDTAAPCKVGKTGAYARASAGFMGKKWDGGDIAFQPLVWELVFRALKPGGHLLAFGGTRTYHRMACAIEDAGFEIRDQIGWAYGSGFPKSHDVSKGIYKSLGAKRDKIKKDGAPAYQRSIGNTRPWMDDPDHTVDCNNPATVEASVWQGWGTALKPAWEPICLARKPLSESSIAANVLKHGTGGINVDGCRVETDTPRPARSNERSASGLSGEGGAVTYGKYAVRGSVAVGETSQGRWPANLIHDGSDEVVELFPDSKGQQSDVRGTEESHTGDDNTNCYGEFGRVPFTKRSDSGSAARFFYCAKANAIDRLGSKHPTVKPLDLMRYLVRLVTPPDGIVLDPFAGTGATGEAAYHEGMRFVLIEMEAEYQADIVKRMGLVSATKSERRAVASAAKEAA